MTTELTNALTAVRRAVYRNERGALHVRTPLLVRDVELVMQAATRQERAETQAQAEPLRPADLAPLLGHKIHVAPAGVVGVLQSVHDAGGSTEGVVLTVYSRSANRLLLPVITSLDQIVQVSA